MTDFYPKADEIIHLKNNNWNEKMKKRMVIILIVRGIAFSRFRVNKNSINWL